MKTENQTTSNPSILPTVLAAFSAIGASACCLGPLLLVSLGISGAWMSTLTSMTSIRPFFIVLTLLFIALGFRNIYQGTPSCSENKTCALPTKKHKQKTLFWVGSILILLLLAFPLYAPFFMA